MPDRFAVRGRLIVDGRLVPGAVVVEGGKLKEVVRGEPAAGSLPSKVLTASVVAPGFIDLQVNGGFGFEAGDDAEALVRLSAALPRTGATAYLPTIVSSEPPFYPRAFAAYATAAAAKQETPSAQPWPAPEGPSSPPSVGAYRAQC
jgi:N-acetylglucosamine-6-phosphate deacetylase